MKLVIKVIVIILFLILLLLSRRVDVVVTAIGAFGGSLKNSSAPQIGAVVMKEAIKRAKIDPKIIDDVRFGCCLEPVDALNATRVAALVCFTSYFVRVAPSNRY